MGRAGRRGALWAPWELSLGQEEWWLFSLAAGAESRTSCRGATMALPGLLAGAVDSHPLHDPQPVGRRWVILVIPGGAGHITGRAHGK